MNRCKHGMIEGQCCVCNTGPVGYHGEKDRNVYGDIDYLDVVEVEPVRLQQIPVDTDADENCAIETIEPEYRNQSLSLQPKIDRLLLIKQRADNRKIMRETKTEETMTIIKKCSNCGEPKELEKNYSKNPGCKDGYEGQCKKCRQEKAKIRRLKKLGKYTGPTTGENRDEEQEVKKKKILKPKDEKPPELLTGDPGGAIPTNEIIFTPADIMKLEADNKMAIKDAARLIIANVEKKLLGAVFAELRNK